MSQWQPIETAPKDGTMFIGWVSAERHSQIDGEGSGYGHDTSEADFCQWKAVVSHPDGGYFDNMMGQIGDAQAVTHWIPIPPPPTTQPEIQKGNEDLVPACWCLTCDPHTVRMALCPECGNKRCPKANNHRHACTGSNEPGQPGSAYPRREAPGDLCSYCMGTGNRTYQSTAYSQCLRCLGTGRVGA